MPEGAATPNPTSAGDAAKPGTAAAGTAANTPTPAPPKPPADAGSDDNEEQAGIDEMLATVATRPRSQETAEDEGSGEEEESTEEGEEEGEEAEGEEGDEAEEAAEKPAKPDAKDAEITRLRGELEKLAQQIQAQTAATPAPAATPEPAAAEAQPTTPEPEGEGLTEMNFMQDATRLGRALRDPKEMNKLLNDVAVQTQKQMLRALPRVIEQTVERQIGIRRSVDDFYAQNADLVAHKGFVSFNLAQVMKDNPGEKDYTKLLAQAAEKTRAGLGLHEKAGKIEGSRRKGKSSAPAFSGGTGGSRVAAPAGEAAAEDGSDPALARQLDEMLPK